MILRSYQQRVLEQLYAWWVAHPGIEQAPLMVLPTGAGKSVVIAELTRLLFDTWPDAHPRTVVLVPSKELAEQNADKLVRLLPSRISIGYYSASLGRKRADADVIVATIGSIYRDAHLLGNIKCVIIDEAHLVNPDGKEAGRFRQFLADLGKYCQFRVVGCTATPFRGNGVWLTDGDAPLFTGVAATVTVQELLDANYLAPLVRPDDLIETRIDTTGIKTTSGDYNLADLAERIDGYLPGVADESCRLAADRKKWIAFTATVDNAGHLAALLNARGIETAVVTGETAKGERERLIADFRSGKLRCLVTVLALATGFDVPDVDCIVWCRPTISPVLYVQGAGRGLRIAPGKDDCLWLDFSDTTERMGPVDAIRGRKKSRAKAGEGVPPHRLCDACGERCAINAAECASCGYVFPEPAPDAQIATASSAAIMAHQVAQRVTTYPVTSVEYGIHRKEGKPDSLRVDYWSGLRRIASEWVCFDHGGFAQAKALNWWARRNLLGHMPRTTAEAKEWLDADYPLSMPAAIVINETGKWPEIVGYHWQPELEAA